MSFGSYDAAYAGGGCVGYSAVFANPTADANQLPIHDTPPLLSGFTGIHNICIPEPTVSVLGALALGIGLLFRRRRDDGPNAGQASGQPPAAKPTGDR